MKHSKYIVLIAAVILLAAFLAFPSFAGCDTDGHTLETVSYVTEPTCTRGGEANVRCTSCGLEFTQKIDALGHKGKTTTLKKPTCTDNGLVEGICEVCGQGYNLYTAPAGHDFAYKETKEASCTENGYELYVCKVCGAEEKRNEVSASHSYEESARTEPDCERAGSVTKVCKVCGETVNEELSPKGHVWNDGETIKNAGLFSKGKVKYTCLNAPEHTKIEDTPSRFAGEPETRVAVFLIAGAVAAAALLTLIKVGNDKKKKAAEKTEA